MIMLKKVKYGEIYRNNNHVAFISKPRFKEGCFKSIDKNGLGVYGASSISYKLEDGTKGYTLSFLVRPWALSHGNLFNLKKKNQEMV